jgi:hypothetical protein
MTRDAIPPSLRRYPTASAIGFATIPATDPDGLSLAAVNPHDRGGGAQGRGQGDGTLTPASCQDAFPWPSLGFSPGPIRKGVRLPRAGPALKRGLGRGTRP